MANYVAPEFDKSAFNCPHCGAFSEQKWSQLHYFDGDVVAQNNNSIFFFNHSLKDHYNRGSYYISKPDMEHQLQILKKLIESDLYVKYRPLDIYAADCSCCECYSYWLDRKVLWPVASTAEMPNADMPEECRKLYLEARDIADKSPRAAAALLRLCVEKLMPYLSGQGKIINDSIAALVKENKIPQPIQRALDICRVVGNNAVHPGEISLEDRPETVFSLFKLLNIIVERTLSAEKQIGALYQTLPQGAQAAIEKRDSKAESE